MVTLPFVRAPLLALLSATLLAGPSAGCGSVVEEPPSLIEQARRKQTARAARAVANGAAERRVTAYVKRKGLHIDLPYLLGKDLARLDEEVIADQLGVEIRREELPESESHVVFERGDAWLYDGRIYRIRRELAHPMDIPTALGTSGFPLRLDGGIESASEVRWNNEWRCRRIRVIKSPSDPSVYTAIDAVRFFPKELE